MASNPDLYQTLLAAIRWFLEHAPLGGLPLGNEILFVLTCILVFWALVWLGRRIGRIVQLHAMAYLTPWGVVTRIVKHVDGDTVRVAPPRRSREKSISVRFIGVDTPESRRSLHQDIAPFGKEAAQYTASRLALRQRVILLFDQDRFDRFGRYLAYVYLPGGEFFNATLVREGYGWSRRYPPNVKFADYFDGLEARARERQLGLWQIYTERKVLRPEYRKSQAYRQFMRQYGSGRRRAS